LLEAIFSLTLWDSSIGRFSLNHGYCGALSGGVGFERMGS
jgi:hypothetical protein